MGESLVKTSPSLLVKNIIEDKLVKKLVKTASIVLVGNTGASILNFITFTIVVNQLGAKLLAIFVLTQTYILIINGIFNIQTWESVVKFGHSEKSDRRFEDVVKINFLMDVGSALVAFLAAIILLKPSVSFFKWDPSIIDLILLFSLSIPFNLTTFKIGIPRMFDKFSVVAKMQIYTSALKLLLVLSATYVDKSIASYVIIFLIVEILNSVILILYSLHLLNSHGHKGWLKGALKADPQQMSFIWWTNLRSIMRIPVQYLDMVIISMVMPLETVGVYKVYKEIAGLLGRVGDPVNQAIFPEYSKLIGSDDSRAAASLAKKTIIILLAVGLILTVVMLLMSKLFVGRLYGPEFMPSINALYLFTVLQGVSFFTLPVNALFVAAGFARLGFYIVVFTNILYLTVAFLLGKMFGIYGIVASYGIQMFFNQGLKVIFLRKYRSGWSNTLR